MPDRVHLLTGSPCAHAGTGPYCPVCGGISATADTAAVLAGVADAQATSATMHRQTDQRSHFAHLANVALRGHGRGSGRSPSAAGIVLRGGDVLQRADALEILAGARSAGFAEIEVWTAGIALARPGAAEAVQAAGATGVALALHGADATAHDWCCGRDGGQKRTLAAIKRSLAAGLKVTVLATVLRPTYRSLVPLVRQALALPIAGVRFVAVAAPDRSEHPLSPPPVLAGPHVATAVKVVRAGRRSVAVDGMPPCVLGETGALGLRTEPVQVCDDVAVPQPGAFGPPCEACTWRAVCPGFAPELLALHGWTGVDARSDSAPATDKQS
jgi:hypothetical protein